MDYLSYFNLKTQPFQTTPDPDFAFDSTEHRLALAKITYAVQSHKGLFLLMGMPGTGKCLGLDTPVMLYDGRIVPVQQVTPGDLLMGPDSRPRTVLSATRGREALYRVTPTKGDPYVVNESHILSLRVTPGHGGKLRRRGGEVINMAVRDLLKEGRSFQRYAKGWRVGVDFPPPPPLRLDPYFLGLWLGDGCSQSPRITTTDVPVVDYLEEFALRTGVILQRVSVKGDRCPMYDLTTGRACGLNGQHLDRNPVRSALRSYDLFGHKHIPHDYKTASECERLELLAGLIDSDGSLNCSGYEFISTQGDLAADVAFVARSLGLAAYVKACSKTCCNNGSTVQCYRVFISGEVNRIPVKVPRKVAQPRQQKKNVLVTGIRVDGIGEGDYYGFEISGDGLFLLGDFTVTHNTTITQLARSGWANSPDKFSIAYVDDPSPRTQAAFMRLVLSGFGQPISRNLQDLKARLRAYLVEQYKAGKTVVLMLDEAQTLSSENLETIRQLFNLQTQKVKLIQIVLLAQPNFQHKLTQKPELQSRIVAATTLNPLTPGESIDLLRHRLDVAGGDFDALFPAETHNPLYDITYGIPRDLCALGDAALINAFALGKKVVDMDALGRAIKDLGPRWVKK